MGQAANERRVADNEARAMAKYLRTSPYKLNLVAQLIRGKKADRALTDLDFSHKRIAQDVKKVLQSAVANAENNHGLDVDKLYVAEAYVGKSIMMKRFRARARGRAARIEKQFSKLTVVVREKEADVKKAEKPKTDAKKTEAKKAAPKKEAAKAKPKADAKKEDVKTEAKETKAKTETKKAPAKKAAPKKEAAKKTTDKKPAAKKADAKPDTKEEKA